MLKRIAVLISGGGSNLQSLIDNIHRADCPQTIVCVLADRPAYGLERAKAAGIPAHLIERKVLSAGEFQRRIEKALEEAGAEVIVLAGYLSILPPELVERYRNRIDNIHPSLIPSFCGMGYYGHKVHEGVLAYGCKVSGATVHLVDEGADTGPILLQKTVPVLDDDTADALAARVLEVEHQLLPAGVRLLCQDRLRVEGRRVRILPQPEV